MQVEIVAHCWRYWRCLTYHLSSLFLDPPNDCRVTATVFFSGEDEGTVQRIQDFERLDWPDQVMLSPRSLPAQKLFRRSIGRNMAALASTADLVWFTDCDFVVSGHAVDELCRLSPQVFGPLMYPKSIRQSPKPLGDEIIADATEWKGPLRPPTEAFQRHRITRAIGALQIVRGDVCRQIGYLNGDGRSQRPANRWKRCFEDVKFRKSLGAKGQGLEMDGVYRLQHLDCGRRNMDVEL